MKLVIFIVNKYMNHCRMAMIKDCNIGFHLTTLLKWASHQFDHIHNIPRYLKLTTQKSIQKIDYLP